MIFFKYLLILTFIATYNISAQETEVDLDKFALTSLLIKDGHLERAEKVYSEITPSEQREDLKRYHTLGGLLALGKSDFKSAVSKFLEAKKHGQKDIELNIYLAQAYYGQENFPAVIEAIKAAPELLKRRPKLALLLANAHWKLAQKSEAFAVMATAIAENPAQTEFKKQYYNYYIELGLYQVAQSEILTAAGSGVWTAFELQAFAAAFLLKNRIEEAKVILNAGLLLNPTHPELTRDLAALMAREKSYFSAALLFDQTLTKNSTYSNEASELYRMSGHPMRALQLSTLIIDPKDKLKQRLALYLENGDFEKAATLENGLTLSGLIEREEIRYALAYAFYKVGNFSKSGRHLNLITSDSLFQKAVGLRTSMEKCQENVWACE